MQRLKELTAQEIAEATYQLQQRGVRYMWLVHHDGGYTPVEEGGDTRLQ